MKVINSFKFIRDRLNNIVAEAVNVAKAREKVSTTFYIPPQIGEFEGYPIFQYDIYVHATIAIPPSVPGIMFRTDGAIVVNQRFMECPECVREASMLHELGHIKLNHKALGFKDKALFSFLGIGRLMEQEYEADLFAVDKGADVLKALEFYAQFDSVAKKAINNRISRLKALTN